MKTSEAARSVGVSGRTLLRWEKSGDVPPVKRDTKGWRIYSERDVERLRKFLAKLHLPQGGAR